MNPLKAIGLCITLGLALCLVFLLLQNIQGFANDAVWWMMLAFAGFVIWVFLKLLLAKEKVG